MLYSFSLRLQALRIRFRQHPAYTRIFPEFLPQPFDLLHYLPQLKSLTGGLGVF